MRVFQNENDYTFVLEIKGIITVLYNSKTSYFKGGRMTSDKYLIGV
jgi:hypothetical protein